MKFLSIKEYFYKLNTIGFILLLPPMVAFIFLEYWMLYHPALIKDSQTVLMLSLVVIIVLLLDLTIVHWVWAVRIKKLRTSLELARKMDGYLSLTIMKMIVYCASSLMMAAGFFVTGEAWFTVLFVAITVALGLQWPSPDRFCSQFELRGSDREMVLFNRDLFQKNRQA